MATDPYNTLGVVKSVSDADLKKAYHSLAKKHHPDLHPGDAANERRFKDISAAYKLLSDKDQRGKYDRGEIDADGNPLHPGFGSAGFKPGGAQSYGKWSNAFNDDGQFDPADLFGDLFGGGRAKKPGSRAGNRKPPPRRGSDISYSLSVDFLEAALGGKKKITLAEGNSLALNVPAGVESRQVLRLSGKGRAGFAGGPPGDALITITVQPHKEFMREGLNILLTLPISIKEAVLGATVSVPTIHNTVSLKVPPGTSSGTTMRLRGKGIKGKNNTGDQLVELMIKLPGKIDPQLKKLAEKVAEYDPRAAA